MDVSGNAYQKISHKPRTKNKVAVAKLAGYNIFTKECLFLTPSVWSACPDRTQSRRYGEEIQHALQTWRVDNKLACLGLADGGFYCAELQERMRWVTPMPEDAITRVPTVQRTWCRQTNQWISLVRGPNTETRFADQTNKLGMIRRKFRWGMPTFDKMLALAEALLNIDRRLARSETVGEKTGAPVSSDQVQESCLFEHSSTKLDDLLADGNYDDEEEENSMSSNPFRYFDQNDVPIALRSLFSNPEEYHMISESPIRRSRKTTLNEDVRRTVEKEQEREEEEEGKEEEEEEEEEEEQGKKGKEKEQTNSTDEENPFEFDDQDRKRRRSQRKGSQRKRSQHKKPLRVAKRRRI